MQPRQRSGSDPGGAGGGGDRPLRVLAYARVSSAAQGERGASLPAQQDRFARWCAARGYPAPALYVEVESAGEGRREARAEYNRLLRDARAGDLVLATVVDRWTRDVVDGVATVRELLKRGCGWVAVDEEIDARTDHGYDQLIQRAAGAEMERRRIRRRTVGTRQELRAQGYHVEGLPPPGYLVKARKLVPDPEKAPTVRRMFALAIEGRTTRQIASELGDLPGFDFGAVARRLRDRRYLGESNTRGARGKFAPVGEWIATHEPLVDRATWDAAQRALDARREGGRRPDPESRVAGYLLRGFARCGGCGYLLRAQHPMPDASTRHGWYVCVRGCGLHARQDDADELVGAMVLERLTEERDRLRGPPAPERKGPDLAAERRRLVARLDRLVEAVAGGTLTAEEARPRLEAARAAIGALDARRAAAEAPQRQEARADLLATVEGLRASWGRLTVAERREALRMLAERVEITRTGKKWARGAWEVEITWRES